MNIMIVFVPVLFIKEVKYMSKEADKARKESNARNRASANKWQRQAESIKADFDKNQKKLERLKKAKTKLTKEMSRMSQLETGTSKLTSDVSASDFKGKLRDDYDKKIKQIKSNIHKDINKLQSNMSQLDAAIAKKEMEQGNIGASLSSALSMVQQFLAAIF